jgi:hypothetical protein
MLTEERLLAREGPLLVAVLAAGILWLLIAWLVLRLNASSIATVGVLVGWCSSPPGSTRSPWPPWPRRLEGLALAPGRQLRPGWAGGLCPAGQQLLRLASVLG